MAKVKRTPAVIKKTVYVKTKEFGAKNSNTIWRTFQASLLGLLIFLADNAKDYVKVVIEKQKKVGEWQVKAEARHKIILDSMAVISHNNNLILQNQTLIIKHFKIKTQ